MRIAADGFIDVRDGRRVRTPGFHDTPVEPVPESQALSFLLSHSFPGHRRIVRTMSVTERKRLRHALWADSVSERMSIVDRIWRAITEAVLPPKDPAEPELVQLVQWDGWVYPVYLDRASTRIIPHGGMPAGEVKGRTEVFRLDRMTA